MKIFFLILSFAVITACRSYGQATDDKKADITTSGKEFTLCLSRGLSFLGPQKDLEKGLKDAGFDDTSPAGWGGGEKTHPFTRKSLLFDLEATYYFNETMGIALSGGLINNIEVIGYEAVGTGNYLFLDSKIKSISLSAVYRTKNSKHVFLAGPAYSLHTVEDVTAGNNSSQNIVRKVGAHLGYSHRILMKKYWGVVIRGAYRWTPKSTVGPFISETFGAVSEFPATDISASCLNVGLGLMMRIPEAESR